MKTMKSFSKLFLLAVVATTFLVGCQKESPADLSDPSDLALEKLILELNFRVSTDGLSDEQIAGQYDALMGLLSEEDRAALIQIVEQAMAQDYASGNANPALSFRAAETLLSAGNPADGFGQGVATAGNKVYVGAPGVQKVYEYAKTGGTYTLINEITPTGESDDFGFFVSVSGSWMAVSAPGFGPPFVPTPGKVFLFKKQGGSWVQQAILNGPAGEFNFGGDGLVLQGSYLAVTSRGATLAAGGSISIFKLNGNSWSLDGTIFEPGLTWFAIDMDDEGDQIVGTGPVGNSLAVVRAAIFTRQGSTWTMEATVVVPPVPGNPFGQAFPRDVAIENNTVVLTSLIPGNKLWVIAKEGGAWAISQELLLAGGAPFSNRFADIHGGKIVIGAASRNNAIPYAVYVFENAGSSWGLTGTLTPSDGGVNAVLWDVAVHGNTVVAGCPGTGFPPPAAPGKTYIFD